MQQRTIAESAQQPKLAEEMQKMAYEPLLPVEKKLIGWSLGLGIVLLIVLLVVARVFIKAAG
ncbi:MAG TPA: hypothetical protein VL742_10050 [Casimicrobiaceae bacterium]|nr:hypothetical protein [Casimicrobiaceae bacterium]